VVIEDATLHTDEDATSTSLLREGGTALVIHAGPDDYFTDPSGASGPRIACAVIQEEL
jgi:Cu-Zn family superoxide dismutase